MAPPPVWLNEGLAEFYSTMKPVGAKVEIGAVIPGRAYALQQGRPMKIADLIDVDHKSPSYNEKDRRGLFYAQAWLLTHMVMMSEDYRPHSLQFLNEVLARKTPAPDAIQKIYGKSLDQLQDDFTSYIRGRTEFYKGVYGVKLSKFADQPDIQPASALDIEATLAELEVLTHKHDRAEKRIAALQQVHASSPEVEEILAYMAWRDGRGDVAKQHFARAIEFGSKNHRLYYDYGRFTCCTPQSVSLLRRSVELNPAFADASVELAIAAAYAKDYDLSLQTFSTLKKVTPERAFDFFYAHALAHSQKGSRTEAAKLLDRAATYAQEEGRQRMIESLRQWLVWAAKRDQMLAQRGAPPAPPELEVESGSEPPPRRLQRRAAPRSTENDPVVPGDASISTIGAGDRALHPDESRKRIQGRLQALECSGDDPVLVVATNDGTLRLTFDDFQKVSVRGTGSSTHEFVCGPLKNVPVSIDSWKPTRWASSASSTSSPRRKLEPCPCPLRSHRRK